MTRVDTAMAALVLGCTDRHIRNLVARGELTNVGTPRRILIEMSELRRVLTERG